MHVILVILAFSHFLLAENENKFSGLTFLFEICSEVKDLNNRCIIFPSKNKLRVNEKQRKWLLSVTSNALGLQ